MKVFFRNLLYYVSFSLFLTGCGIATMGYELANYSVPYSVLINVLDKNEFTAVAEIILEDYDYDILESNLYILAKKRGIDRYVYIELNGYKDNKLNVMIWLKRKNKNRFSFEVLSEYAEFETLPYDSEIKDIGKDMVVHFKHNAE